MNNTSSERRAASAAAMRQLLDEQTLRPHFQPVVELRDGSLYGHEALIRPPAGCPWTTPDELFATAREAGLSIELELQCLRLALDAWARSGAAGKLFVNLSAGALVTALAQRGIESMMTLSRRASVAPDGLVVELTEHEQVRDIDALIAAVARLRRHKVSVALDDFGDGRSSLRLWSELKPEIVKIDKYFTRHLAQHPEKLQTLRALQQISHTLGSALVAEGIETANDLHLVRDLGIRLGQGWLLGRPQSEPMPQAPHEALAVLRSKDVAVFPERRRNTQQRASARTLMQETPAVAPSMSNEELFTLFGSDESLRAVAIVEDGWPLGLIGRQHFVGRYSKPYFRELYGRKPCTLFANLAPQQVELHHGLDELTAVLTSEDQRYLAEGIVITENGRYRGLASGEDLVRTVTEARIEAARHANPLTLLPGNIPITQHIQRLIQARREFVACYADLNHFKPFNDQYGYWRGDEMILLAAKIIGEHADPRRDFVGHVGGDDFLVLFQSDDWEQRSQDIVDGFNLRAHDMYDEAAQQAGGLLAEDRHGVQRLHPLTTITIGAVRVVAGSGAGAEEVANAAAAAKRQAKAGKAGVYLIDAPSLR